MPCPYKFETYSTAKLIQRQRQKRPHEGGRYKFKTNGKGWRSEDRRYECNTGRATVWC
jgi:hypothetical protein